MIYVNTYRDNDSRFAAFDFLFCGDSLCSSSSARFCGNTPAAADRRVDLVALVFAMV